MGDFAEILAIQVTLTGIQQALAGLERLATQLQANDRALAQLARTGAVYVSMALLIAGASLQAYDSFIRFDMGARTLLGTIEGGRFSRALQEFAVPSAFDPQVLRRYAQGLLLREGGSRTMDIVRSSTDVAAAGGANSESMGRIGYALMQISQMGTVRSEELRKQLMGAEGGAAIAVAVAEQLGKKNPNELVGTSSKDFFDALIKAGKQGRFAGAQERLAQASPLVALENTVQALQNALIPTGAILAVIVYWFTKLAQVVIGIFGFFNEWLGGLPGLVIVTFLLYRGFMMMWPLIRLVVSAYLGQLPAVNAVTAALWRLAGAATAAGASSAIVPAIAGGGAAVASASIWFRVGLAIGRLLGFVIAVLSPFAKLAAIVIAVIAVMWTLAKLIEWIVSWFVNIKPEDSWSNKMERTGESIWNYANGKGYVDFKTDRKKEAVSAAERPQRRSSWENIYYRRFGTGMGG